MNFRFATLVQLVVLVASVLAIVKLGSGTYVPWGWLAGVVGLVVAVVLLASTLSSPAEGQSLDLPAWTRWLPGGPSVGCVGIVAVALVLFFMGLFAWLG